MERKSIAEVIMSRVECSKGADYSIWRIGLTHDPEERAMQHGDRGLDVKHWMHWRADSLEDARAIEAYFIDKGMAGGSGGDLSPITPVFVYIF